MSLNDFITDYYPQLCARAKAISKDFYQELISELFIHLNSLHKKKQDKYWNILDKTNDKSLVNYCGKTMHNFYNLDQTRFNRKIKNWDRDRISINSELPYEFGDTYDEFEVEDEDLSNPLNKEEYYDDSFNIQIIADMYSDLVMNQSEMRYKTPKEDFRGKDMTYTEYETLFNKNTNKDYTGAQPFTYAEFLRDLNNNHTKYQMDAIIRVHLIKKSLSLTDRILFEYRYEQHLSNRKIAKITGLTKEIVNAMVIAFDIKIKQLFEQI